MKSPCYKRPLVPGKCLGSFVLAGEREFRRMERIALSAFIHKKLSREQRDEDAATLHGSAVSGFMYLMFSLRHMFFILSSWI